MSRQQRYDPNYHSSVVMNMKRLWEEAKQNEPLRLSDEEIWNVFNEWYFVSLSDKDKKEYEGYLQFRGINENDLPYLIGLQEANSMKEG